MRYFFFGVVFASILSLTIFRRGRYAFSLPLAIITALLLTVVGVLGTYILGFLETGNWNAISYYGAVFFVPIVFFPIAKCMNVAYSRLMDYSAPCGAAALVMKFLCVIKGCCGGIVLWTAGEKEVRFPSQIVELVNAFVIVVVLLVIERKKDVKGKLYPLFLIIYGSTRFVLNWFRETVPFVWILPAGNFWSIVSVIAGIIWLLVLKKHEGLASYDDPVKAAVEELPAVETTEE